MSTSSNLPSELSSSRQQVLRDVKQIVSEFTSTPPENIQETHTLLSDLGCDSLDVIEISMEVEEHFDISVPDDQEQDIRTVADIVDGVLRLLGPGQPH